MEHSQRPSSHSQKLPKAVLTHGCRVCQLPTHSQSYRTLYPTSYYVGRVVALVGETNHLGKSFIKLLTSMSNGSIIPSTHTL